jgi:hypothetical protein
VTIKGSGEGDDKNGGQGGKKRGARENKNMGQNNVPEFCLAVGSTTGRLL